ncbi:hypothetical protein L6452_36457 [Arctium lappa]|uniref:Uncharacterized protein n=1 Tax=Arctium lappa TaxID=4217 RepID=A0ACB8Y9X9_ARCLA|nr:hypothetical protein L6452_36457 [Arctium lappa]
MKQNLTMDYPTILLLLSLLLTFIYSVITFGRRNSRLPPGPYSLPIIGNLLELGDKPHRSLTILSRRYGPLMSLKFGSITTIVVSSPTIAKEFFHTHDTAFSGRSVSLVAQVDDHHKYSVTFLDAGDQWRRLRRIAKEYLFSRKYLDGSEQLRQAKVQELIDHVNHCCTHEKAVNIGTTAFTTTLNILSNFLFSMDLSQYDYVSSQEFKDAVKGLMEVGGKPNLADLFPILKAFDPQGLVQEGNIYAKKISVIFDKIIDQRLQTRSSSSSYDGLSSASNDVLDMLFNLNSKDDLEFSQNDMKHLFMDLFTAGTDTTSSTVEWAMAELIRNPKKMEKVWLELVKLMKNNNKNIEEHDISQLPYLQAVIKETLRLHPPGPFLVPHRAIHDVEVQGFIVPKNAQIIYNVWAIGRDPSIWLDPETFMPERFLEVGIDYKGHDFEFIPFGAGKRICPGLNLAHRMLHIILGSLILKFDWKLEGNMRAQDIDMGEKFGLTLPRNVALMAIPIKL